MKTKVKQPLLKILVCDDDPADRKLVRLYLEKIADKEIAILEAGQKTDIQNALAKSRIDLILMDVQMPDKSGMEWLAEIAEKQTTPVVMLTGAGSEEIAVQALQDGAIGYLPKNGLSAEKLIKAVDAALEKWRLLQQSQANQEELERLANFDALTGLHNRRALLHRLDKQISHCRRYGEKLSLSLLDIDNFKKVNDQYGHLAGDDVLEKVATLVQLNVRDSDITGRYGGEEFIVILPKSDFSSAATIAERLRKAIETAEIIGSEGDTFHVTVSQGLASYKLGEDKESLISRADDALYRAKENGRNRVETSAQQLHYQ